MIPILYMAYTEGTVPTDYGVGPLTDCLGYEVTEERNGAYELTLTYPLNGIHADKLQFDYIIKAKPNYTDDPQLFRIYSVNRNMNGRIEVHAQHISYDLSGKVITTGTAGTCAAACALLTANAGNFTISTTKSTTGSFSITEPSSVRSWFAGKTGSLLDVFGTGEWYYDNFTATLKLARGQDRGVTIRYGKNLTELSQDIDCSNLCTSVTPYYVDSNTKAVTVGDEVYTDLPYNVPRRDIAIDFSGDVDPESATPIMTQLDNLANDYIANHILDRAISSLTIDFVQYAEFSERVDLCDTVTVYFDALGISTSLKCVKTVWDGLKERYTSITLGDSRTNIADTFAQMQKDVEERPTGSIMEEAISRATELISGNLGGYIVMHDGDGDGYPDEFLIMDTPDISTAVKVWRFNQNGLGYSGSGYAGPFNKIALTSDGQIVATAITTGTLNADLIKAGVIQDVAGNSEIDMANGQAKMKDFIAKNTVTLWDTSGAPRAVIGATYAGGSSFRVIDAAGTYRGSLFEDPSGSTAGVEFKDANSVEMAQLDSGNSGEPFGRLFIHNASGTTTVSIKGGASDGEVNVHNSNGYIRNKHTVGTYGGDSKYYNGSGKVTAELCSWNYGGGLWLYNNNEKKQVILNTETYGGDLSIYTWSEYIAGKLKVDTYGGDLTLYNNSGSRMVELASWQYGGGLWLYDSSANEKLTLETGTTGGAVQIKNTAGNPAVRISVNGSANGSVSVRDSSGDTKASLFVGSSNDGTLNLYDGSGTNTINLSGQSGVVTCVSVTQTSSRKVKENIKPIEDASKILELEAVSFDYKNKEQGTDKRGFIAEDVREVLPNLVQDGEVPTLDYIGMIPYLQEVIKQQQKRIEALEKIIMGGQINGTDKA